MIAFVKKHWLLIASIIYLLWPIDLLVDILGPFGLIDDASILIAAISKEVTDYYKAKKLSDESENKL